MLQTAQAKEKRARLVITDRAVSWLSARVPAFEAGFATFVERIGAERLSERQTGIAGTVIY